MEESEESRWLKEHWDQEFLGRYDNHWIAIYRNEVIAWGENIRSINEKIRSIEGEQLHPLFAYIYFGRIQ